MPIRLFIIRHAPVINKAGVIYGDDADIDLETTKARIDELATLLPDVDHADWYHSGVDRAERTGKAVLAARGQDANWQAHQGFREQDFGALLHKTHAEVTDHLQFVAGKIYAPAPPMGETIQAFIQRVGMGIKDVQQRAVAGKKENIVIFSHGGAIRAAHAYFNSLADDAFIDLDTPPLHLYVHNI